MKNRIHKQLKQYQAFSRNVFFFIASLKEREGFAARADESLMQTNVGSDSEYWEYLADRSDSKPSY